MQSGRPSQQPSAGEFVTRNHGAAAAVEVGGIDVFTKCPRGVDTAVYLLGGLDAAESAQFARHLEDCPGCQTEFDELAPVARLLALARRRPEAFR